MDDYYNFANVVLKIEHDKDDLFKYIDNEINQYQIKEKDHVFFTRIKKTSKIEVPNKAIRTNVFDGQAIYAHNKKIFIIGKDKEYSIVMDPVKREMIVDYIDDTEELRLMLRLLLKWSIIISAQENGMVYIHASAAHYNGKNIIFCGDSHCGKSSSLLRLVRNGAKAISDDSVLFDGKGLVPFSMNTTIDKDLEKRFEIKSKSFKIEKYVDHDFEYGKPDTIIFLKIWNNDTSEIKKMDYKIALLNLIRIYKKEIPFVWAILNKDITDGTGDIFKKYASLVEGVDCFEFYAGYEEVEVRKKLLEFLGD
ncbi:hypothetical protein JXA56_01355 [Candidatus Micrarchaeota archaeon]|nr:hypothetical protein [Candidatus Micrarchaeota archaeon]